MTSALGPSIYATSLLGVERDAFPGRTLKSFLTPASRPTLLGLLARLGKSGAKQTCEVKSDVRTNGPRRLHVTATVSPDEGNFLLVYTESGPQ